MSSWVELSCVGGVYTPVGCGDPVCKSNVWLQQLGMLRLLRKRARYGKNRKIWCRQWIANHGRQVAHGNLLHELSDSETAI